MLSKPLVSDRDKLAVERRIFPSEARERLTTYKSKLSVSIKWRIHDEDGVTAREHEEIRECGMLPVMVRVSLVTHPYRRTSSSFGDFSL